MYKLFRGCKVTASKVSTFGVAALALRYAEYRVNSSDKVVVLDPSLSEYYDHICNIRVNMSDTSKIRRIRKAFLITGGSESDRCEKATQLIRNDGVCLYGSYKSTDELVIVFAYIHEDFEGMSFEEAKILAGSILLPPSFKTHTTDYFREPRFGIISCDSPSEENRINPRLA